MKTIGTIEFDDGKRYLCANGRRWMVTGTFDLRIARYCVLAESFAGTPHYASRLEEAERFERSQLQRLHEARTPQRPH